LKRAPGVRTQKRNDLLVYFVDINSI